MILKKQFNLLILLTLILSFKSILCFDTSLVRLTQRFLKGLPEFIGFDIERGMTNEMKAFYASNKAWNADKFTLKNNELALAFDAFIARFRYDVAYNDASKWVKKIKPPQSLFDFLKNPLEIAYPYIQKAIVPAGSTIFFIGDTHASPHSFLRSLWRLRIRGFLNSYITLKKNCYFVILGDYVDFGNGGAELWNMLITLKLNNWNQVFMLRGNHELLTESQAWNNSTFYSELEYKFGDTHTKILENKIKCAYNLLPHALLIGTENDYILCGHGGVEARFNAHKLLQSGIFYEHLNATYNYAYGDTVLGGWTNNRFIGRLYSNDPETQPIETDINALPIQYSSGNKKTHLVARGHQHGAVPECFCFAKRGYPIGTNPDTTVLPDWQAENNVSAGSQRAISQGSFKLADPNYYPIYTLFSATALFTRYDCFARITVAEKFSNWTFEMNQQDVDTNQLFLRNFARFELDKKNEIRTVYSRDKKPFKEPLSEALITFTNTKPLMA